MAGEFVLDAELFLRNAVAVRTQVLPYAGARVKAFLDEVMDNTKATIEQYYTNEGNADPSGPNPGELRDSGYVDDPQYQGVTVVVEAGFGRNAAQEYAVAVHEGHHLVAWGHDTSIELPPAKYWETPLMEAMPRFEEETGGEIGQFIARTWS